MFRYLNFHRMLEKLSQNIIEKVIYVSMFSYNVLTELCCKTLSIKT